MASKQQPVRLALIGLGVIGQRHLQLTASESECRLVAVADPGSHAAALASSAGVPHYRSYLEMLENGRPEGVIVAAPTPLHLPIGLDCVRQGVPMLMEKPFTDMVESGRALIAAAEAAGVPIAVGHHRRFDPAVKAAHAILRSNEIGRLIGVSGIWAVRKPDSYYDVEWRRRPGGGPLLINIIHDIDMLRYCCGEIESVYAETSARGRNLEVEDSGAILLRFASGALATISFSDTAPSPWGWERATGDNPAIPPAGENCYHFFGSTGSFEFPNIIFWRNESGAEPSWNRGIVAHECPLPARAALADQLKHFCQVVRAGAEPVVGPADALATVAAATAVHESARMGGPVTPSYRLTV